MIRENAYRQSSPDTANRHAAYDLLPTVAHLDVNRTSLRPVSSGGWETSIPLSGNGLLPRQTVATVSFGSGVYL